MSRHPFELQFRRTNSTGVVDPARPLKMLILARSPEFAPAMPRKVDHDTFEELMRNATGSLQVRYELPDGEREATLKMADLEDFDPGRIAQQIPELAQLESWRRDLGSPAKAAGAIEALSSLVASPASPPPVATTQAPPSAKTDDDSFASLLGGDTKRRAETPGNAAVRRLIADALAGESEAATHSINQELSDAVAELRHDVIRQVLRDETLRDAERRWRSINWLVTNLDVNEAIELWLVNLPDSVEAAAEAVHRAESGADGNPFSLLLLDQSIASAEDVALVASLGEIAQETNATLLTGISPGPGGYDPAVPGLPTLDEQWTELRRAPQASHIAAALPRVLLRAPFGRRGEASDLNKFEELMPTPEHAAFLWGNPAYALALLIGQQFESRGWEMGLDVLLEIDDMPLALFDDGSGDSVMPPAERFLDEHDVAALAANGIMALQSFRNRNAVRLSQFHPIV